MDKTILVHNVNEKAWLEFAGYCKAKKLKIGNHLSDVLSDYNNKKGAKDEE